MLHLYSIRAALRGLLLLALCAFSVGFRPGLAPVFAQSSATPPASADTREAVLAESRRLRESAEQERDPWRRYKLWNEAAQVLWRAELAQAANALLDAMMRDEKLSDGHRSLVASARAVQLAITGQRGQSERALQLARDLARNVSNEDLAKLPGNPTYSYLHATAEVSRRMDNQHDVALGHMRELVSLAASHLTDASRPEGLRAAATNDLRSNISLYAITLAQNNRGLEAVNFADDVERAMVAAKSPPSALTASAIATARAIGLMSLNDYEGAFAMIEMSLDYLREAKVPNNTPTMAQALRFKLFNALALGRLGEFQEDASRLVEIQSANPVAAGSFPLDESRAMLLGSQGRWADASRALDNLVDWQMRNQGPSSPFLKYQRSIQMTLRLQDREQPVSPRALQSYVDAVISTGDDWWEGRYVGSYLEQAAMSEAVRQLAQAGLRDPDLLAAAFRGSQYLNASVAQGSLADGIAKVTARNPELKALIEEETRLRLDTQTGRTALAIVQRRLDRMNQNPNSDPQVLAREGRQVNSARETFKAVGDRLSDLRRKIDSKFPEYRNWVRPPPSEAAELGQALAANEALLSLQQTPGGGIAFLVRNGQPLRAAMVDRSRQDILKLVMRLRKPFDTSEVPSRPGELEGFDVDAAHALYRAWVEPLKEHLSGVNTVYISTSGILATVPWPTLVTAPAAQLADVRWWIEEVAPVTVPDGAALRALRNAQLKESNGRVVAYADPQYRRNGTGTTASTGARRGMLSFDPKLLGRVEYENIPPLPETADEVKAIAAVFPGNEHRLVTGAQARRSRVLADRNDDASTLIFAMHAVKAGELPGLFVPALAMAYEGSGAGDSLLTANDVLNLKLNADWVVLSACNTGTITGASWESMSALQRAFFFAGSRSILLTQWAVETESAKRLTVATFGGFAGNPTMSKAQALVQAQRRMMTGGEGELFRHPYFWAGYALAGDGRR